MGRFTDQVIYRAVGFLKGRHAAFRFVRKHLKNTVFHRMARSAVRNVRMRLAADARDTHPTRYWDHSVALVESKERKGWLDWEFVEVEHIRPQLSGNKSLYYLQHFLRNHLPSMPAQRAMSLGCGGGNLERALIQLNAASCIDALDASPESIRIAAELAAKDGVGDRIHYKVADIERLDLEPGIYDFVVAKMSLHHFNDLDHVYAEVRRALKPEGVFMFNEFVGPTRFQWTELQLALVNRLLQILPEQHRRSAFSGEILAEITRPTIEDMIWIDPTEAVNSSQILPLLRRHFEIVEQRNYGGTLLHLLLNDIMANFDLTDEVQASLLRTIFLFERTLVEHKVLDSDFCYVVARPLR